MCNECDICYSSVERLVCLPCLHEICRNCYENPLLANCPFCRKPFKISARVEKSSVYQPPNREYIYDGARMICIRRRRRRRDIITEHFSNSYGNWSLQSYNQPLINRSKKSKSKKSKSKKSKSKRKKIKTNHNRKRENQQKNYQARMYNRV